LLLNFFTKNPLIYWFFRNHSVCEEFRLRKTLKTYDFFVIIFLIIEYLYEKQQLLLVFS